MTYKTVPFKMQDSATTATCKVKYVLGFLFNHDMSKVVLIKKERPEWQKGKLNGVGGKVKVDENEVSFVALCREINEECGITVTYDELELVRILQFTDTDKNGNKIDILVYVYYVILDARFDLVYSVSDETIVISDIELVKNLPTLDDIPSLIDTCIVSHRHALKSKT